MLHACGSPVVARPGAGGARRYVGFLGPLGLPPGDVLAQPSEVFFADLRVLEELFLVLLQELVEPLQQQFAFIPPIAWIGWTTSHVGRLLVAPLARLASHSAA